MIQCICSFREIHWRLERENNIILLCKACSRLEYTLTLSVGHKKVKTKQYLITLDEFNLFKNMGKFNNRKGYLKFIMIKFSEKNRVYKQTFYSVRSVTSPRKSRSRLSRGCDWYFTCFFLPLPFKSRACGSTGRIPSSFSGIISLEIIMTIPWQYFCICIYAPRIENTNKTKTKNRI